MAETPKKNDQPAAAPPDANPAARKRMGVRLTPVNNSEQSVVANYATVRTSPGMVFIDFGFIEPGLMAAIPRVAKQGGKLPDAVNGKLAVRVGIGYDGIAALRDQLSAVLAQIHKRKV